MWHLIFTLGLCSYRYGRWDYWQVGKFCLIHFKQFEKYYKTKKNKAWDSQNAPWKWKKECFLYPGTTKTVYSRCTEESESILLDFPHILLKPDYGHVPPAPWEQRKRRYHLGAPDMFWFLNQATTFWGKCSSCTSETFPFRGVQFVFLLCWAVLES